MKHIRRYKEDLFFLESDRSVFENISVGTRKRDRDLKAGMPVSRVVFSFVVVPDPHVGVRYKINLFDVIADDPSGKVSDRLLVVAGYRIIA